MVNISAKFDKETCNGSVSIVFTRSMPGRTHGTTAALLYPHRNALRGDNKRCQKTTTLARQQPSLNSSWGKSFSKVDQTSRSRSWGQKLWYHVKGLVTKNTHVQYESPLLVRKLWPRLKFFKSRSNFNVKVTRSKIMVPCESSCHKKYTCAIWKPYHFW